MSSKKKGTADPSSKDEEEGTTTPPTPPAVPAPPTTAPAAGAATTARVGPTPATSAPSTAAASKTSASKSAALAKKIAEKQVYSELAKSALKQLQDKSLPVVPVNWDEVSELAMSMQYDAFDPQVIKIRLLERTGAVASTVMNLALAAIYFGNNPYERVKKTVDPVKLESLMNTMRSMNIIRKKVDSESLTLARIGQSHPLLILQIRAELSKRGLLPSNGITSATPVPAVYQDLALTPLSDKIPEIKPFIVAFAKALYQHAKRTSQDRGLTEEQWLDNQEKFRTISTASWARDDQFGAMDTETLKKISVNQVLALLTYK